MTFPFALGIFAAVALALSGCGRTPDSSLSCTGDVTGWFCHLRPGMSYLGLRLGLDKEAAFRNLCEGANARYFYDPVSTFDSDDIRNGETVGAGFVFDGPIKCSYWDAMKNSYAWYFYSSHGACLLISEEKIVVKFHANKLSYFEVGCMTMPVI
jgi:hypothetical protein